MGSEVDMEILVEEVEKVEEEGMEEEVLEDGEEVEKE